MLTILSLLVAGLITNIPILLKLFEIRIRYRHELELAKERHKLRTVELDTEESITNATLSVREGDSVRAHDMSFSGNDFWYYMRSSIRPTITYLFFLFFLAVKCLIFYEMVYVQQISFSTGILALWDETTGAMFGAIMGFWFGGRLIDKHWQTPQPRRR